MSVQMHPTNSRTTTSSTTISSRPSFLPRPRLSTRPTLRPSNPPPLPAPVTLPPGVEILSAADYASLHAEYTSESLPVDQLFPWLHQSADVSGSHAAQYFGFGRNSAAKTPAYRGLTTVFCPPAPVQPTPVPTPSPSARRFASSAFSTVSSDDDASSISSSASSSSSSDYDSDSDTATHPPPTSPSYPTSILVSSFPISMLVSTVSTPSGRQVGRFNLPSHNPKAVVNLRAFGEVAKKYASVSDVVIYAKEGLYLNGVGAEGKRRLNPSLVEAAVRTAEAMEAKKIERRKKGDTVGEYRIWVIADPFSEFEAKHPTLVAIDSQGYQRNMQHFFQREKEEMRVLTQASEIGPGVWLGNTQDVPVKPSPLTKQRSRVPTSDSSSSLASIDDRNPMGFSICVDTFEDARCPEVNRLRDIDDAFTTLEDEQNEHSWLSDVLSSSASCASVTSHTPAAPYLRPPPSSIAYLTAPSSLAPAPGVSHATVAHKVDQLVYFASWLRQQANPAATECRSSRRVLISCLDGYTESSLLALTYVMLDRGIPLPEAYLTLQRAGRSFFVYSQDVEVLLKVEKRIAALLQAERERQGLKEGSSSMERSDSGFVDSSAPSTPLPSVVVEFSDEEDEGVARKSGVEEIVVKRDRTDMRVSSPMSHPWFFADTFEGHFPSRILPYLYLGNLKHAKNALMLKSLGITHVLSMGESALQPPRQPPFSLTSPLASRSQLPTNSLWLEQKLGQISVLDLKCLADDGIDPIGGCFEEALRFIDEARQTGGRVLVHCRVGVSRSATIVIAYLMAMCQLDLTSAYLLTRSRRLNILIQPNLPFAATLHAFEAELLRNQDEYRRTTEGEDDIDNDELGAPGLKWANRLSFPFFAQEIATLNERFLSCAS